MDSIAIKRALKAGEPVFGTWSHLPLTQVVEIIGSTGYDFIVFDLEHGPHSFGDLPALICAAESQGMTPVVRVPGPDNSNILRALDSGAKGILVPHVSDARQARTCVAAMYYGASAENRGVATLTRSSMFGAVPEAEHLATQNQKIVSAVMIEDKKGLDDLDGICAVPDLDIIFIGIYDLAQSLGIDGGMHGPAFQALYAETAARITATGIAVGGYAPDPDSVPKLLEMGLRLITVSVDGGMLRTAYQGFADRLGRLR